VPAERFEQVRAPIQCRVQIERIDRPPRALAQITLSLACSVVSQPSSPPADAAPPPRLDPIITEVLYAVPTYEGDANRDGERNATGDEFIELTNPHDTPIQLRGYTLTDRNAPDKGQMKFVFPTLTLEPGEVVVRPKNEPTGTT